MPHATCGANQGLLKSVRSQAWSNAGCQHCLRGTPLPARATKPARGHSRRHASQVCAVSAATDFSDDPRQLFQDALKTWQQSAPKISDPQTEPSSETLNTAKVPEPAEADQGFLGQVGVPAGPANEPAAEAVKSQAEPAAEAVKSQAAPAAEAVKSQAAPAAEAVKSQVQEAAPSSEPFGQGLQAATPSPSDAADNAQPAAQSAIEQLQNMAKQDFAPADAVKGLTEQVNEATSSAAQSVQESVQAASDTVTDAVSQVEQGLQSSIESAAASVSSQVNEAASSLLQALPAPVSERLQAAAAAVEPTFKEFSTYAYSDPKAGAAVATVAVGLPLFVYWRARLSGYAGQLPPARAKAQLNRKNTLLIDIRKEETRNTRGIPLLKRRSRGKGAAIPIQPITSSSARASRQGQGLSLEITALQIAGLKQVGQRTRLVIMDQSGGSDAVAIARSLRSLSRRKVFVLEGGFSAWEKQGLDVQSTDVNYKTTVFDSLSDEVESLGERASSFLRDPVIAAGAVGGLGLGGVALIDWHFALQYVGILGAQLSLINWVTSYDSPQDAFADLQANVQQIVTRTTGVFKSGRQAIASTTQQPDLSYSELPTSGAVDPEVMTDDMPDSNSSSRGSDENSQQSSQQSASRR